MSSYRFSAQLDWTKLPEDTLIQQRTKYKNHTIAYQNGMTVAVSAAKEFKGDAALLNPEELLLSSLMSCHMMSFLYVCQKENITVLSYEDNGIAELVVYTNNSGQIKTVNLHPKTILKANEHQTIDVNALHKTAHQLCFIANSCNFKVNIISNNTFV